MVQVLNSYGGHGMTLMPLSEIAYLVHQLEALAGFSHSPVTFFSMITNNYYFISLPNKIMWTA